MISDLTLFIILQIINVILSTIKSIVMIKGNKWFTISCNTIYYAFYNIAIKQLTKIDDLFMLCIITALTNFFGTWIGLVITEKVRKDELWTISTIVKTDYLKDYKKDLNESKIKYKSFITSWDGYSAIDIISESRKQSKKIKEIISKHKADYSVYKVTKKL